MWGGQSVPISMATSSRARGASRQSWKAMSALFNDYLLDYSPRSLNGLQLSADGQNLRVQGKVFSVIRHLS